MAAANRGPRGSMPRAVSGMGALRRQSLKLELEHVPVRDTAEAGLYGAVAVEHEGCGGLQHVEVARDIGPVGQVDIQVTHPGARLRDLGERPVDRWAPAAHLGTELQQGGSVAESVGSEASGLNDLVVDIAPQASLTGAQQDADHDGDRNKRGDAQQGGDGFHGNPH